jgi:hypothetical protein
VRVGQIPGRKPAHERKPARPAPQMGCSSSVSENHIQTYR